MKHLDYHEIQKIAYYSSFLVKHDWKYDNDEGMWTKLGEIKTIFPFNDEESSFETEQFDLKEAYWQELETQNHLKVALGE